MTVDTEQLARAIYDRALRGHKRNPHHEMVAFGDHAGYAQDMAYAASLAAANPDKTINQLVEIVFPPNG